MRFYDDLTEWWPLVDEPSDATGVCARGLRVWDTARGDGVRSVTGIWERWKHRGPAVRGS